MSHWRWRLWIQANEPPVELVAIDPAPKPLPPRFRPHVEATYKRHRWRPPIGAVSTTVVGCWTCGDQHASWERRAWNGSHSACPKCGSDIVTFADERLELRARVR